MKSDSNSWRYTFLVGTFKKCFDILADIVNPASSSRIFAILWAKLVQIPFTFTSVAKTLDSPSQNLHESTYEQFTSQYTPRIRPEEVDGVDLLDGTNPDLAQTFATLQIHSP